MNAEQRHEIARRVARDLPDGSYVNLGVGLPTLVADVLMRDRDVVFHSENGILGVGPAPSSDAADPHLINAGKRAVTLVPGASFFDHATSFMVIRGGHLDVAVMGAYEVAANGDLANWSVDDLERPPAVGGAMDLAAGARAVWIMMEHTTKGGAPRLLDRCRFPLTAEGVVRRIYSEIATLDVIDGMFVVRELAAAATFDEVRKRTGGPIREALAREAVEQGS